MALHAADPRLGGATHRRRSYPNSPPWWNEECNKLSRIRLAKLKKYLAVSSYENYLDFQIFDAHTTKRLKQINSANFKSFCEYLSTSTPANLETLEHMNEYTRSFLTMAGDTGSAEIPSLPENFLSLGPIHPFPSSSSIGILSMSSSSLNSDILCSPFSFEELTSALEKTKKIGLPRVLTKLVFWY